MHQGALLEGSWDGESVQVSDVNEARTMLADLLRPGDVVLVKSSRDAGLRFLGDWLATESTEGGPA